MHLNYVDSNNASYIIRVVSPISAITAILSFMAVSSIRSDSKGTIDDVTEYVD